jgi:hypothetical protein
MKNKEKIEAHIRKTCLEMSKKEKGVEDIEIARKIWEKSKDTDLDAITIRSKIFEDLRYCFLCGEPLSDFRTFKNGIPHCLLPCCV